MKRRRSAKLPMLLVFPALACMPAGGIGTGSPAKQAQAHAVDEPTPAELPAAQEASSPAETLALADRAYQSRLGAGRGQFSVDRQVAVLQQEILLYSQFLERAEGQPELEPAIRKSRDRIVDAKATLVFLQSQQRAGAEPPPAPTE